MDVLSRDDLELLVRQPRSSCVSLYMPTHRSRPETQQDPIRLKNLIRRAEESLVAAGIRRPDASEVLRPARAHRGRGLLAASERWACPVPADWVVPLLPTPFPFRGDGRGLRPVPRVPAAALLTGDGHFFVLALSENESRLLAGTLRHSRRERARPAGGVKDALRYDDPQGTRVPCRGAGGPGARVVLHGQGIGAEVQKERLGRYLHAVDGAVHRSLREQQALVLAGVEYVRAMYRDVNTYPHLLEAGISGSPDRTSTEELHTRAWALMEPHFARERDNAAAAYREALGTGRASASFGDVLTAAEAGRIEVLFVPTGASALSVSPASAGVSHSR